MALPRMMAAEKLRVLSQPSEMKTLHFSTSDIRVCLVCDTAITLPETKLQHRLFQTRQEGKTQHDKIDTKMHHHRKVQILNLQALLPCG